MPEYECVDCGLTYQAEKPDGQINQEVLCQACWEEARNARFEAAEQQEEADFEPDLIGSQWYHEDLP